MRKRKFKQEWFWAYVFIAPMVIGTLIFGIVPILYSAGLSLMKWDGLGEKTFNGLTNFVNLMKDEKFRYEIRNTLVYTIAVVPITLMLSLGVANLLNKGLQATGFFRVIYFLPNIVMPVAVAMVWRFLLNSKVGLVNVFLRVLHLPTPGWISDPKYIMASLVIISVWSGVGYNAIIMLAGLQGISPSLYESARLDGASSIRIFWKITFPLLSPTLFFLTTMSIMNSMRAFDIIYTFIGKADQGGPIVDASRTVVFGIYDKAFKFLNMGGASAEAMILFFMIAVITVVQFKLQDKWVFYE
ncbi:sn-glycerol-3-phosphate transport system permease protein ugpA [uncultured Clostridium sp.]|uniref:carbohydrate ABC transporter permease n=1 Tax=Blautia sp. OF03-15BH TaxID=2292287 RepID=UPI000820B678|nr:sugar ABC transporter permease [Blautia sp. OF03-15BH]MDY2898169.1 sugar ABC transporter permease [Candidatus Limivivens sp.]RGY00372.1 sugar ABC transporter permease [Blautia sp. OF03-15BH]SCG89736.1 sn-glycerol-3-phosphate transport system permease protein ugpA [uncultured Clostridium sp.]